jgi:hypothetical protein
MPPLDVFGPPDVDGPPLDALDPEPAPLSLELQPDTVAIATSTSRIGPFEDTEAIVER